MAGVRLGLEMSGERREPKDTGFIAFFGSDDTGNDVSVVDAKVLDRTDIDFPPECATYVVSQSGDFCTVETPDEASCDLYAMSRTENEVHSNGEVFIEAQGMHLTDTL